MISVFNLYDIDGTTVLHKMYMIRNPWGVTYYNGTWKHDDAAWTTAFKAQVPHSVDPTTSHNDGIMFINAADFLTCFDDFQIAEYRDNEGYTDDWYDKNGDAGTETSYTVNVPAKNGDLYFSVESYYQG